MENNDLKKFKKSDHYFLDKDNRLYFKSDRSGKTELIQEVDIHTFAFLSNSYSCDQQNIYYESRLLKRKYKGFTDYKRYGYFKIDNTLYWFGKKVVNKFHCDLTNIDKHFFTDGENLFVNGKMFSFDRESFTLLSNHYAKDKTQVFHSAKRIAEADVESFKVLMEHSALPEEWVAKYSFLKEDGFTPWACDKNHVYFCGEVFLDGIIDPASTKIYKISVLKDHAHVYYFDKIVEGADPNTFEPIINHSIVAENKTDLFSDFCRDRHTLYYNISMIKQTKIPMVPISKLKLKDYREVLKRLLWHSESYQLTTNEIETVRTLLKK